MSPRNDLSRLRLRLQEQLRSLESLAGVSLGRSGMLQGSLYERRRKCGRPRCRCAQGRLHTSVALAVGPARSRRIVTISRMEAEAVRSLTLGYRQFRDARAAMARTFRALMRTFDGLGRLRSVGAQDLRRSSGIG